MRRSAIPELAIVLLLAPAATAAQTTAASTAMHGAEASGARPEAHVCATLPAPVGSVRTTVYANLEVQEYITSDGWKRRREVARDNLALVLDDIASRVTVHPPLVTPVFATAFMVRIHKRISAANAPRAVTGPSTITPASPASDRGR